MTIQSRTQIIEPVRKRFMGNATWRDVAISAGIWLGVSAFCLWLAMLTAIIFRRVEDWPAVFGYTLLVLMIISVGLPMLAAGMTALPIARDASGEQFHLLRLTDVNTWAIVWSYFVGALYRLRLVLAVMCGAMAYPVMLAWVQAFYDIGTVCEATCEYPRILPLLPWTGLFTGFTMLYFILSWMGPLIMAVAAGVGIGLRMRGNWVRPGPLILIAGQSGFVLATSMSLVFIVFAQGCLAALIGYGAAAVVVLAIAQNWVWLDVEQ